MAFASFDPTLPLPLDRVRVLLGDTDVYSAVVADAAIMGYLDASRSEEETALLLAKYLLAQATQQGMTGPQIAAWRLLVGELDGRTIRIRKLARPTLITRGAEHS